MKFVQSPSCAPLVVLLVLVLAFVPARLFDNALFLFLNHWHSSVTDYLWLALTTLGDGFLLVIILGCFLLVNPRVTALGILLMLLSAMVVHLTKSIFPAGRPIELLESVHVVGPVLKWGSFPSGHAAAAMSVGLAVVYFCHSRAARAAVLGIALLISLSRIFVGAHFPTDVLGGIICALAMFLLTTSEVWPKVKELIPERPSFSKRLFRLAFFLETVLALFGLFVYSPYFAELPPFGAAISVTVLMILGIGYRNHRSGQAF